MADEQLAGFLGTWQEESKEGFDEMAKGLGLPEDKKDLYKAARTSISYGKQGDKWTINVGLLGTQNCRCFEFTLGQEYDSADIDGSPMKSLVSADGNRLKEKHINEGLQGEEMKIERWIDGDTMMVKTTCRGYSMISKYKRA